MDALLVAYVDIDQDIHYYKSKVGNEKWKHLSVFIFRKYGKIWSVSLNHFLFLKNGTTKQFCPCNELTNKKFIYYYLIMYSYFLDTCDDNIDLYW